MKLSEIKWYINDGQFDINKLKEKYKEDPNKLKLLSNPKNSGNFNKMIYLFMIGY